MNLGLIVTSTVLPRMIGTIIEESDEHYMIQIDATHIILGHKNYWKKASELYE